MNKYKWIIGSLIFILIAVICFYSFEIYKLKRDYEMLRLSQVNTENSKFEQIDENKLLDKDENLADSGIADLEDSRLFGEEFYNDGLGTMEGEDLKNVDQTLETRTQVEKEQPKKITLKQEQRNSQVAKSQSTKTFSTPSSKKAPTNTNGKKCYNDLNMCFLQLSPSATSNKGSFYKPIDCSDGKNIDKCGVIPSKTTEDYWAGAKYACEAHNMWLPDLTVLSSAFLTMSDKTPFQQDYYTTNEISPRRVISVTSMGNEFRTAKTDTNVYALCVEYIE